MQYDSLQQIGLSLGQQAKRSLIDHHQSKSCSLLYKYTEKMHLKSQPQALKITQGHQTGASPFSLAMQKFETKRTGIT